MTPWASIARIEVDGDHSGTGFLVTERLVLTALHVVADQNGRPFGRIRLHFNTNAELHDGSEVFETGASIVPGLSSTGHDFALLECDSVSPSSKPLVLSDRYVRFQPCASPGFAIQDPQGFTAIGKISSLNDPVDGDTAIGIQFEFGSGVLMKGHSGAPLFVNERVAGLLRTAFLDESQKTMGGIVHATSIHQVVEFCNQQTRGLLNYYAPILWPPPLANHLRILADFKEEFGIFERMITGKITQRVLLLKGESGSGKTVLIGELREYARQLGVQVAHADCKGCPSMDAVFGSLLSDLPPKFLPNTETAIGVSRMSSMIEDLTALTQPLLLCLDTWQASSDDVRKWIEQRFVPEMRGLPGVVAVVGGQEIPRQTAASWGDIAVIRELDSPPSQDDWLEYTQRKWPSANITPQHVEGIVLGAGAKARPDSIHNALYTLQDGLQSRATQRGGG